MFLSFIIPVFNAEKYLKECLDSLKEQDISCEDYEIICVDDGSTDDSLSILNDFAARNDNIIIIRKPNGGVSSARNAGIAAAHGDYIWFVDSDDFIQRNCLQEFKQIVVETQCDAIQFGAYSFTDVFSVEVSQKYQLGELTPNTYANNVFVTRSIFKRDTLRNYHLKFCEKLKYSEDKLFLSEFFANAPKIVRTEKLAYYYRFHTGSAITCAHLQSLDDRIMNWSIVIVAFQKLYQQCSAYYKTPIADNLMAEVYRCLYSAATSSKEQFTILYNWIKAERILFIKRPPECTITKSYLMNSGGIKNAVFDYLYCHTNSLFGFWAMRLMLLLYHQLQRRV